MSNDELAVSILKKLVTDEQGWFSVGYGSVRVDCRADLTEAESEFLKGLVDAAEVTQ